MATSRQSPERIRCGDVFWLDNCPPLDGHYEKRRPVVVISPDDHLAQDLDVVVVAISTSVLRAEIDRVPLPNRQDEPQTRSGLPKPCWAVPRWHLRVSRNVLTNRAGFLNKRLVATIFAAVLARMRAAAARTDNRTRDA